MFEKITYSQLENRNSINKMSNSMQKVSQEIFSSQESFKNAISSNLTNANKEVNLKITELESCIKLLAAKLEKCQQPPNSVDLPKSQKHVQNDLITVQKTQVIPGLTADQSHSNKLQSNKDNMGTTLKDESENKESIEIKQFPPSASEANDINDFGKNKPILSSAIEATKDEKGNVEE